MNEKEFALYKNISQCLTLKGVAEKEGRNTQSEDLGIIEDAAIIVDTDTNKIEWIGSSKEVPRDYTNVLDSYDAKGEVWLPQFVECHTHLIFGGSRHRDFASRCRGKTYQEIAKEGGGILTTMTHTRNASIDELQDRARDQIDRFEDFGVGTIEIKTGYGLTLESELKVLECIKQLQDEASLLIVPTFLPAHAVPPEFKGRADDYVKTICNEWLPEVSKNKLAQFFDVFIEEGYFNATQARTLCEAAKEHGLGLKLHVDQFNDIGGTLLGLELGATSLDHLDHISKENIKKMGQSQTVAVMLPGASLFAGTPYPPARELIDSGAIVALATDYNPGTCPSRNLALMTTLGCTQMKMTPEETIAAITYNAAKALGVQDQVGSLK